MFMIQSSRLLRTALGLDAVACAGTGLLLALGAGALDAPLGFPAEFLRGAGFVLLPCAALLAWFASRETLLRQAAYAVIFVNVVWIAGSLGLLLTGWFRPSGLGIGFVLAQAVAVAIVTELELIGFKRSAGLEPAPLTA